MRLVRLERIENKYQIKNEIYALLGMDNPTGSIKDVTVKQMLLAYQKAGMLIPGCTILEATSGNTGISLAYFQKEFDYKALIIMPSSMSKERREKISSYGASLNLVDGGMQECEMLADKMASEMDNAFVFDQFKCQNNHLAHYQVTGQEIYGQLKEINYLFAGIGTGGTISGTSKYLKEKINIKTIGIEPLESPLITKGFASAHLIQGIGANFIPATYHNEYVDEVITVEGLKAIEMAKEIREIEALDIGISSGCALQGCLDYLKENQIKNQKVVLIFPDKGDRYSW